MALKDLLALTDKKLQAEFERKTIDPKKARGVALRGIARTKDQFASTEPVKGRKWFKVNNSVVEFAPPFRIGGQYVHYVPSERFSDFLGVLHKAVNAGELDEELTKDDGAPRRAKGGTGKGWTPERRARYEATMKAKGKG